MYKFLFYLLFFITLSNYGNSQELNFTTPIKLPETINTPYEESVPQYNSKTKTLFFSRSFYPKNEGGIKAGSDIWYSKFKNNTWTEASNEIKHLNNSGNNFVIGLKPTNNIIYLNNAYDKNGGMAFSYYQNGVWSKPETLNFPKIKKKGFIDYHINKDYTTTLLTIEGDIYYSLIDSLGNWSFPKSLGSTINTDALEFSPFLSADSKYLYFASKGHSGFGDSDIFVSERLYNGWEVWSKPVNLGKGINSEYFEGYFSIYEDSLCFFSSNRNSTYADIYSAAIIKNTSVKNSLFQINQKVASLDVITNESTYLKLSEGITINFDEESYILDKRTISELTNFLDHSNKNKLAIQFSILNQLQPPESELMKLRMINFLTFLGRNNVDIESITLLPVSAYGSSLIRIASILD